MTKILVFGSRVVVVRMCLRNFWSRNSFFHVKKFHSMSFFIHNGKLHFLSIQFYPRKRKIQQWRWNICMYWYVHLVRYLGSVHVLTIVTSWQFEDVMITRQEVLLPIPVLCNRLKIQTRGRQIRFSCIPT